MEKGAQYNESTREDWPSSSHFFLLVQETSVTEVYYL